MSTRSLFEQLLHADHEDDVVAILDAAGYGLDNSDAWIPLGSNEGNFTVVGNQQENPSAAFMEKIVNSIDAVLLRGCYEKGVDPEGAEAPPTMQAAVDQFFGVKGGRLDSLTSKEQTDLAERIHVVVTGQKSSPCYLVVDSGEGQTPDQFPETFLSASRRSPKIRIPFVQGKFNAGGTGSLQFCGKHNIQLIASRRHPAAPSSDGSRDLWGFTVVRRRRPTGGERGSVFVYLAPKGSVLRFKAEAIRALPGKSKKDVPAPPYTADLPHGTCVKLYNYRWPARGTATLETRFEIERNLQKPCLPIRVTETRAYKANYYSTTVVGVWNTISMEDPSSESRKMETGFPASANVSIRDIGQLPLTIGVWKEDVDTRRVPTDVFFLVNGQVHGALTSEFVSRRLKFDYIRDHLVIAVDCTDIDRSVAEDLFMASRDRLRRNEQYDAIRDALADVLQNHPGLRELNAQRRKARAEKEAEDPAQVANLLSKLIQADPSLARLFGEGSRLITSTGPGPQPPFKGRRFPTYFRLEKGPKSGLVKHCPINRTARVTFETDADNDYFERTLEPGKIEVFPTPDLIESSHLWNGHFSVRFRVPWDSRPGDSTKVRVEVTDVERVAKGPFISELELIAEKEAEPPSKKSGEKNGKGTPSPNRDGQATSLALPNPIEVYKAEWAKHGFRGPSDSLRVKRSESGMDFFINMDNSYLLTECADRKNDPVLIKHWFKWGLILAALGMIREQEDRARQDDATSEDEAMPNLDDIGRACDGLARVMIPMIRVLHEGPGVSP